MTDDIFRIVVMTAVVLAGVGFVVQAGMAILLYRVVRRMQQQTGALVDRAEPVIEKLGPLIDKAGPVIDRAGPMMAKAGVAIDKAGVAIDKAGAVIEDVGAAVDRITLTVEKAGPVIDRAGPVLADAGRVLTTTNRILEEARPRITEISAEALEITKSGRQQVERIGNLVNDASERASARLDQIDQAVESTVHQVQQAGDAMKRVVMRPVREVNGIAAGISAAVSTLVHGTRKAHPDAATQDEEMFI
jgi:ABC-type transporter Mla subunit MlaD